MPMGDEKFRFINSFGVRPPIPGFQRNHRIITHMDDTRRVSHIKHIRVLSASAIPQNVFDLASPFVVN